MKRSAEFQLTKDDSDIKENEDSEESNSGQGFQRASQSELATRKIKPLPSRLGGTGTPKPAFSGITAPVTTTPTTSKVSNGITESSLTKYYTDFRGLNVSLLNHIKNSVESDPFSDFTSTLESYKTHRSKIQKEYDEALGKEKTKPRTSAPLFGSTAFQSATKLSFPFGSSTSNPFSPPATNLFGSSTSAFGTPVDISNPDKKPAPSIAFGSSTSAFGTPVDISNPDKKPAPSVAFGSPSPATKNTGVFYGFGSGTQSSGTSTKPSSAAASEVGSQETTTEDGIADTGSEGTEPKEPLPGLRTFNPHDEEGAGEENEETVHAVKLKAYRMRKVTEQGGSGWAELGMGILRLKKDKESGARRMLLRNSTNGKININFKIYPSLKPSISKNALTFVGHFEGGSQTYCVRLPSEEQANELKTALDREIEFVKAKETQ